MARTISKAAKARIQLVNDIAVKHPEILTIKVEGHQSPGGIFHAGEDSGYYYCMSAVKKLPKVEVTLTEMHASACRRCVVNNLYRVGKKNPLLSTLGASYATRGEVELDYLLETLASALACIERVNNFLKDPKSSFKAARAVANSLESQKSSLAYSSFTPSGKSGEQALWALLKKVKRAFFSSAKKFAEVEMTWFLNEALEAVSARPSIIGASRELNRALKLQAAATAEKLKAEDKWCLLVSRRKFGFDDELYGVFRKLPSFQIGTSATLFQMPNYAYAHMCNSDESFGALLNAAPWVHKGPIDTASLEVVTTLHSDNPDLSAAELVKIAAHL